MNNGKFALYTFIVLMFFPFWIPYKIVEGTKGGSYVMLLFFLIFRLFATHKGLYMSACIMFWATVLVIVGWMIDRVLRSLEDAHNP